jgi:hypothetical protein
MLVTTNVRDVTRSSATTSAALGGPAEIFTDQLAGLALRWLRSRLYALHYFAFGVAPSVSCPVVALSVSLLFAIGSRVG